MNKLTLASHMIHECLGKLMRRARCLLRGETYHADPGPQWQQLELPFSRTPVKRWNR